MKTYDFDAVARQAVQHVEQAVQRGSRNGSQSPIGRSERVGHALR